MSTPTTAADCAMRIGILRARLADRGALSTQEQAERARLLEALESLDATAGAIVSEYVAAGRDAVLYVHDSGDVLLWDSQGAADNDDGTRAIGRWQVGQDTREALEPLAESAS